MTFKTKPLTGILSWMVIASLAVLSTDAAWSEAPRNTQNKKSVVKKSVAKKPKATTKKRTRPSAISTKPAAKAAPIVGTTAPAVESGQSLGAAQPGKIAATQAPSPATSIPIQPQVSSNPYLTVQQPNPWQVQVYKGAPANVNPYLAYRYAAPAATPWSAGPAQFPLFTQPTWVSPFLAFQPAAIPPANAWNPPAFQAPQFTPLALANPYLAYRQPVVPSTPWTPPAFQRPPIAAPAWVNPIQPAPQASLPTPWTPPAIRAPVPTALPAWAGNPYLAYMRAPSMGSEPARPASPAPMPQVEQAAPSDSGDRIAGSLPTPWSTPSPAVAVKPAENAASTKSLGQMWDSFRYSVLPDMPPSDQAILPTIKTVYPTGEKPLKVLTFKCPTELVGVSPPTTKALHGIVNMAFDGLNKSNILPFNMQQVCQ